jgi:hypothetical protein
MVHKDRLVQLEVLVLLGIRVLQVHKEKWEPQVQQAIKVLQAIKDQQVILDLQDRKAMLEPQVRLEI